MSIVPEYRRCPNCKQIYSFYPEGGRFTCPHCLGVDPIKKGIKWIRKIKRLVSDFKK